MTEPGFAFIRKKECEALRRCKSSASAALIFIRSEIMTHESEPFACGSRDFKPCGLGRDAAASALSELRREGLIERLSAGSLTRGKKATWRIVHTQERGRITAGKSANPKTDTVGKPANSGRKTRQLKENTAGKSAPLEETSSTSSQKSKEEEGSLDRETRQRAFRDQLARIERAARARGMTDKQFIDHAGGREQADQLARAFLESAAASTESGQGETDPPEASNASRLDEGSRLGEENREEPSASELDAHQAGVVEFSTAQVAMKLRQFEEAFNDERGKESGNPYHVPSELLKWLREYAASHKGEARSGAPHPAQAERRLGEFDEWLTDWRRECSRRRAANNRAMKKNAGR